MSSYKEISNSIKSSYSHIITTHLLQLRVSCFPSELNFTLLHKSTATSISFLWSNVSVSISFLACNSKQIYECLCCIPSYATLHYLPTVNAHY